MAGGRKQQGAAIPAKPKNQGGVDAMNEFVALQTADHGSEELLDAVELLDSTGAGEIVDEVLEERFGEFGRTEEEESLKEQLSSEGEKYVKATKGRGWQGLTAREGRGRRVLKKPPDLPGAWDDGPAWTSWAEV
jgi:hypothetical protein